MLWVPSFGSSRMNKLLWRCFQLIQVFLKQFSCFIGELKIFKIKKKSSLFFKRSFCFHSRLALNTAKLFTIQFSISRFYVAAHRMLHCFYFFYQISFSHSCLFRFPPWTSFFKRRWRRSSFSLFMTEWHNENMLFYRLVNNLIAGFKKLYGRQSLVYCLLSYWKLWHNTRSPFLCWPFTMSFISTEEINLEISRLLCDRL